MMSIKLARRCAIAPHNVRNLTLTLALAASAAALFAGSGASAAEPAAQRGDAAAPPPARLHVDLAAFEWLAGEWVIVDGKRRIEEVWTRPAADMMLGMSRTLEGDRTVSFEFVRIAARPDGVFYIAQPRGKPPVAFPLQSWDGTTAVFVNDGSSDHLKRIVYRRDGPGLTASVEGANDGKQFTETYPYHRPAAIPAAAAGR